MKEEGREMGDSSIPVTDRKVAEPSNMDIWVDELGYTAEFFDIEGLSFIRYYDAKRRSYYISCIVEDSRGVEVELKFYPHSKRTFPSFNINY